MSPESTKASSNKHNRRSIRSSPTSTRLYRSFSSALASASSPTCHTQRASSIFRSGRIETSTARKCAIQRSSTRQSASSVRPPRFRLTAKSKRSSRPQYPVAVSSDSTSRSMVRVGVRCRASSSPRLPNSPVVAYASTVCRSAAITAPSESTLTRCGRKSISAARASNGSAASPRIWRRSTCVSWCTNSGGTSTPSPWNSAAYADSRSGAPSSRSRKRSQMW